jgi:phosphoadenosine phosphosulfate reductase
VHEAIVTILNGLDRRLLIAERIAWACAHIPGRRVFTTSFGLEDQVITAAISQSGHDVEIVTLDTGRLFAQTYQLWSETERRYGRRIRAVYPERQSLEELVARQGIDGMYVSLDNRLACCGVRKVAPLQRALADAQGWITGLRADQSAARAAVTFARYDNEHHLVKINPLFDHSRADLMALAVAAAIPINSLHGQGFASIGCAPCTRAIADGEPERAGRWWWENEGKMECGLHVTADGRLRAAALGSP